MSAKPVLPQDQCADPSCKGIKAPGLQSCFVHADAAGFQVAAAKATAAGVSPEFDLTGTPLTQDAIDRIVSACPTSAGTGRRIIGNLDCGAATPVEAIRLDRIEVEKLRLDDLVSDHDVSLDVEVTGVMTLYNLSAPNLSLSLSGSGTVIASHTRVADTLTVILDAFSSELRASPLAATHIDIRPGRSPGAIVAISPFGGDVSAIGGQLHELRLENGEISGDIDLGGIEATGGVSVRETEAQTLNIDGCELAGLDLTNARLVYDLNLHGGRAGHAHATGLTIGGEFVVRDVALASLTGPATSGLLDLAGCTVEGPLDLTDAELDRLVLDGITVRGPTVLSRVKVNSHASLRAATLTSFRSAGGVYEQSLCLDLIEVSGDVTLRGARVRQILGLERARIEGDLELADLVAERAVIASGVRVGGALTLEARTMELDLGGAEVEGPARIHVAADRASLIDVTFRARSELLTKGPGDGRACALDLRAAEPRDRMLVDGRSSTAVIDLRGTRCDELQLREVSLERCLFDTATGLAELRLTGDAFARKPSPLGRGRVVLAEDPDFTPSMVRDESGHVPDEARDVLTGREVAGPARMADRYRSLRNGLEENKDSAGAAEFYFSEMQMRRRAAPARSFERAVLAAYRTTGGYGARPLAPTLCLLALFLAMTGIATLAGSVKKAPDSAVNLTLPARDCRWVTIGKPPTAALHCGQTTGTLQESAARVEHNAAAVSLVVASATLGFNRTLDSRLDSLGQVVVMVARILGAALLAFIALGLRSVVRR